VILTGWDSYFTQGTRAETLYQNPQDFDRAFTLEQTRAEKPCQTLKNSNRDSVLKLRGGLPIGQEALWPSEPRLSPDKAMAATTLRMRALQVEFLSNGVCLLITTRGGVFIGLWESSTDLAKAVTHQVVVGWPGGTASSTLAFLFS
jgi:hypothetical protein